MTTEPQILATTADDGATTSDAETTSVAMTISQSVTSSTDAFIAEVTTTQDLSGLLLQNITVVASSGERGVAPAGAASTYPHFCFVRLNFIKY